jgi:hypothetical protein
MVRPVRIGIAVIAEFALQPILLRFSFINRFTLIAAAVIVQANGAVAKRVKNSTPR